MFADLILDLTEPHPELVASKKPTPAQVTAAIGVMGLLTGPDDRWFVPAVRA